MSAEQVPGWFTQKRESWAIRSHNARSAVFDSSVKRQVANGLHFTAMSGLAAITSNLLNAWMADRGMHGRVFSITVQPNPNPPAHVNPRKRTI
jgi:hypothetical protein